MTAKELEKRKSIWRTVAPVLLKQYRRDKTFLTWKNPWQLSVAVTLSAQTTDDMVNKVTPALFKKYPTPQKLATAPIGDIEKLISRLGFFRSKAKYIKAAAKIVNDDFRGVIPHDPVLLQKLPGIGRKGAVAVISNGYPKYANIGIPVDTHVIRFAKRFKLSKHSDPSKIEQDLLQIIPKKDWKKAGYAIKEYGRKEGRARGYEPAADPLMQAIKKH